jgi:quercetin dioxygenase-like cupin family protein
MNITRIGSQPSSRGPAEYFTGNVRIDSPFQRGAPARVSGAIVTFEPGARPHRMAHASTWPDADRHVGSGTRAACWGFDRTHRAR